MLLYYILQGQPSEGCIFFSHITFKNNPWFFQVMEMDFYTMENIGLIKGNIQI